ncbi:hypothetical protein B0H15DRAFT_861540 [Mycena belliarum]|uniref:DUF6534 domain-containing protein n=1 Tax=Mycena belliarum TaxID=1033014 RepID=A0AAD6TWE1_9AGAR|nr:hypothetical protein B0H15DRAFT_861540 [Mycena belliae]
MSHCADLYNAQVSLGLCSAAVPPNPHHTTHLMSYQSQDGADPAAAALDYGALVSSQLIGSLLNFFFYGILLIQTYVYRVSFPKDPIALKSLVYVIFFAMTVCICLNAADVQFWFGDGFGDTSRFADAHFARFYAPLMGSIIAMLVQLFFCYRIFVIRPSAWPLSAIIAVIAVAQCAGGVGAGIEALTYINNIPGLQRVILPTIWVVGAAVADILIATVMTLLPSNATSLASARDTLRSLVRITVETNAFTAGTAAIVLGLYVGFPSTTYFLGPALMLPGIYANTLLVTLNNRVLTRMAVHAAAARKATTGPHYISRASQYSGAASAPSVPPRNPDRRTFDSERTAISTRPLSADESRWRSEGKTYPADDESVYTIEDDEKSA